MAEADYFAANSIVDHISTKNMVVKGWFSLYLFTFCVKWFSFYSVLF